MAPSENVYDFFERVPMSIVNKKTLESLIFSGAFDSFGLQREIYSAPMETGMMIPSSPPSCASVRSARQSRVSMNLPSSEAMTKPCRSPRPHTSDTLRRALGYGAPQ